jgi:predicted restriction endonuclease
VAFKQRTRKNIINTNKNECSFCGYNEFPEILECAHIVKQADNKEANEEQHGIMLCPNCHEIYDRGLFTTEHFEKFKKRKMDNMNLETKAYFETGEWPSWVK